MAHGNPDVDEYPGWRTLDNGVHKRRRIKFRVSNNKSLNKKAYRVCLNKKEEILKKV